MIVLEPKILAQRLINDLGRARARAYAEKLGQNDTELGRAYREAVALIPEMCRECGLSPADHAGICEGCWSYCEHQH